MIVYKKTEKKIVIFENTKTSNDYSIYLLGVLF